uniref:ATP synthase F0 subunit 8 n=1 Tax=Eligma narcissus TaxID=938228 RepID=UPI001FAFA8AA|nr:ATP synthase F0 subunit 8 [Eligma narcissus]UNP54148.1 ATP synthase F0 subunit 8 [Eligma narcissus]
MPQMMPINWILLFFYFLMIFILFNILNYYIFNIKPQNNNMKMNKNNVKNFYWKW